MPKPSPAELRGFDRSLPMALLKAREVVMKKFLPSLREHDLSAQQWRVIRALVSQDGLEMTDLAERCFLLMPSLSRIVQRLEERKLIQRRSVARDQRCTTIHLTRQGKALYEQIAPKSVERYQYITEQFGYGKLELLYELLDELVVKLQAQEQDEPPRQAKK